MFLFGPTETGKQVAVVPFVRVFIIVVTNWF